MATIALCALTIGLGACATLKSYIPRAIAAAPDITAIVADATSAKPDYAADISTGIDIANDFEPGSQVPLLKIQSAVEDGINVATGSRLTSASDDIAAALKVLPDVMTAEQATTALMDLSKQASRVSTTATVQTSP